LTWLLKIEFYSKKDLEEYVQNTEITSPLTPQRDGFERGIIDMEFEELEEN